MKLTTAFLAMLVLPSIQACPFSQPGGENPHEDHRALQDEEEPIAGLPKYIADRDLQDSFNGSAKDAIQKASEEIVDIMNQDSRFGPKFVRLGFHDCVGGCNGCVDMENADNAGLDLPMLALMGTAAFYENQLTRADVWALAAMTAANATQQADSRVSYSFDFYGRETCDDMSGGPVIQMPSNHITTDGLLNFFKEEFDFDQQQSVAIMGAHTL